MFAFIGKFQPLYQEPWNYQWDYAKCYMMIKIAFKARSINMRISEASVRTTKSSYQDSTLITSVQGDWSASLILQLPLVLKDPTSPAELAHSGQIQAFQQAKSPVCRV